MTCPTCGRDNPAGTRFCRQCGSSLSLSSAEVVPPRDLVALQPAPENQENENSQAIEVWRLRVVEGEGRGAAYELANRVMLGRELGSDVLLGDPHASRAHAQIQRLGAEYVLQDLDSSNGTLLNGVRLQEARPLRPGDRIQIESVIFEVEVSLETCNRCGATLTPGGRFCGQCGHPIGAQISSHVVDPDPMIQLTPDTGDLPVAVGDGSTIAHIVRPAAASKRRSWWQPALILFLLLAGVGACALALQWF